MAGRRSYDDGCAVAHALDLVGERWALLVVRELLLGPKRFTDLLAGLRGASTDVLTQRLRQLTEAGLIRRRRLGPPAGTWVYELTRWGSELEPIVISLAHWSSRSPDMRPDAPISVDSLMLELKTLFDAPSAAGMTATLALHLDDDRFQVTVTGGRLEITRAEPAHPDATLTTNLDTMRHLVHTNAPLGQLTSSGAVKITGDMNLIDHWRRLFPLPEPVSIEDRS